MDSQNQGIRETNERTRLLRPLGEKTHHHHTAPTECDEMQAVWPRDVSITSLNAPPIGSKSFSVTAISHPPPRSSPHPEFTVAASFRHTIRPATTRPHAARTGGHFSLAAPSRFAPSCGCAGGLTRSPQEPCRSTTPFHAARLSVSPALTGKVVCKRDPPNTSTGTEAVGDFRRTIPGSFGGSASVKKKALAVDALVRMTARIKAFMKLTNAPNCNGQAQPPISARPTPAGSWT